MIKDNHEHLLNGDFLEPLGDKSKLICIWVSIKKETNITQLTEELRIPLTTVAHIIPQLIKKDLIFRSGDIIKPSKKLQQHIHLQV